MRIAFAPRVKNGLIYALCEIALRACIVFAAALARCIDVAARAPPPVARMRARKKIAPDC
jgi:hypothetical protein